MIKPRNRIELWGFIYLHFGLGLAHRAFSPNHSTPFGFVAEAFFNPGRDVGAWSSRSGGKTLGASIVAALEFLFTDGLQARVLSGSEDQARNLYEYWSKWCEGPLAGRVEGIVRRQLTQVAGGRLEILAASPKRVRGPKVQRLFEDELDEIDRDLDSAAVGMIASNGELPGRTVYTSTWHRANGQMAWLVEGCPENGVSLHKWNIWEAIEQCPPSRHDHGRGCVDCRLASTCVAKAEEVAARGPGHGGTDILAHAGRELGIAAHGSGLYSVADAIKAYSKISRSSWEAEYECKRPSAQGLVFPEFDQHGHRCENPPADLTVYRSIDWGHGVFVCLWIGEDKDGTSYLLDTYRAEHGTVAGHAKHILAHPLKNIEATYCDPAGRNTNDQTGMSNVEVFRSFQIRCSYTLTPKAREVANGIQTVRGALQDASGRNNFFYLPSDNNRVFVKAMHSYKNMKVNDVWIDKPQDPQEFEHIPDALRYYFVNRRLPTSVGVVRLSAS